MDGKPYLAGEGWTITDQSIGDAAQLAQARADGEPDLLAFSTSVGEEITFRALVDRAAAIAPALAELAGAGGCLTIAARIGTFGPVAALASMIAGLRVTFVDADDPADRLDHLVALLGWPVVHAAEIDVPIDRHLAAIHALDVPEHPPRAPDGLTGHPDILVTTSGSTSAPKVAKLPVGRWYSSWSQEEAYSRRRTMGASGVGTYACSGNYVTVCRRGSTMSQFDSRRGSTSDLAAFIVRNQVTALSFTPTAVRALQRVTGGEPLAAPIERVNLRGERVTGNDLRDAHRLAPNAEIGHLYASTEAGAVARWSWFPGDPVPDGLLPLQVARDGRDVRVLLPNGEIRRTAPVEPAELLAHHDLLFEGYVGRDADESFVEFEGKRWLRTGDLVTLDDDDRLRVHGRAGRRVKVGGMFVDADEIAVALEAIDGVHQAAVTSYDDGESVRLVGHVVPERDDLDTVAVRAELARRLPVHQVPSLVRIVRDPPVNKSGKLDNLALEAWRPDLAERHADDRILDPATPVEGRLLVLTSDLVGRAVDLDDDLVDLGMVSIAWVEVVERLALEFGLDVELGELFAAPTVRAIARLVGRGSAGASMIAINSGGDGTPIVWAPNGMAAQEPVGIARELRDHALYVPLARGFGRPGRVALRVGDVVDDIVDAIDTEGLRGPIAVAGFSTSSHHAQALAARLVTSGTEVPLLVLLDPPGRGRWQPSSLRARLRVERDAWRSRRTLRRPDEHDAATVHWALWLARRRETLRTRLPAYGGPVLIVRPSMSPLSAVGPPDGLTGPVRIEEIDGDHFAAVTDGPTVAALIADAMPSRPHL